MSNSVDISTQQTYGSALNSWLAFANMHHFSLEPTTDTLSFYIVYMCHHINPRSVKTYLSGLVQQLEPEFPAIREIRTSPIVTKVMKGCLKLQTKSIKRKEPLSISDLHYLNTRFQSSPSHDDLLFLTILSTGFHGLLRLGELTFPDNPSLQDWRKATKRSSLIIHPQRLEYEFLLPAHKADRYFEGNRVLIRAFSSSAFDPFSLFLRYLSSRDNYFPASSPLWLTASGTIPTRSFFMSRFRIFFSKAFGGASMRAGGATYLAQLGTPSKIIRAFGRWSSDAWEVYIRIHPSLLQALFHNR
jgi:hypothetical protein